MASALRWGKSARISRSPTALGERVGDSPPYAKAKPASDFCSISNKRFAAGLYS